MWEGGGEEGGRDRKITIVEEFVNIANGIQKSLKI